MLDTGYSMLDKNVKQSDDYQVSRIKYQVSITQWQNSLQFVFELETPKFFFSNICVLRHAPR